MTRPEQATEEASKAVSPAVRRWGIVILTATGLILAGLISFAVFRPIVVLPRMGLAPGYSLVDQSGERLTSEDLRGSIAVYTFGYTRCEGPCEAADSVMRVLQDRLPELETDGIPVRLVTLSFDPDRDDPDALAAAAAAHGADPAVWSWATGEAAMLKNVIGGGFEVYYEALDDGTFRHDMAFVLVDGLGIVRSSYRVGVPDVDRVLGDIRLILQEARAATGLSRLAYEAAHLLACYPR